jgi:hypothetical protein
MSKVDVSFVAIILGLLIASQVTLVFTLTRIDKSIEKTTQLFKIVIEKYSKPKEGVE